jgi:hypothetical protein
VNENKDEIKKGRRKTTNKKTDDPKVTDEIKVVEEVKVKKPRTKKTKVIEETKATEVTNDTNDTNDTKVVEETKPKKPRTKKTKVAEETKSVEEIKVPEEVKIVEEIKVVDEPKTKKTRTKKTNDTKVVEEKSKKTSKPRTKKTTVTDDNSKESTPHDVTTNSSTNNNTTIINEIINMSKIKNMGRLHIINFINPSWYIQINEFLQEHPAFYKLIPIVALDEYPNGFNKNPHEDDKDAPINIFETILYGLAFAGADIDYGKYQYLLMQNYFRESELYEDMDMPEDAQPEKVPIYKALVKRLLEEKISIEELSYCPEHMEVIESVEGMTESTVTLLYLLYDEVTRDRCLPYGDKQFKRGMSMFYELENPTKEELKAITNTWTNKKVGLMFVVQYAHYSEFV